MDRSSVAGPRGSNGEADMGNLGFRMMAAVTPMLVRLSVPSRKTNGSADRQNSYHSCMIDNWRYRLVRPYA